MTLYIRLMIWEDRRAFGLTTMRNICSLLALVNLLGSASRPLAAVHGATAAAPREGVRYFSQLLFRCFAFCFMLKNTHEYLLLL